MHVGSILCNPQDSLVHGALRLVRSQELHVPAWRAVVFLNYLFDCILCNCMGILRFQLCLIPGYHDHVIANKV